MNDITKYSLYDIIEDTKHLDTPTTCEYISSLVTTFQYHYEKEESNKIILIPLYPNITYSQQKTVVKHLINLINSCSTNY